MERSTEQAILDAAERLFLEKGFARTSTTEIAKAAGCNQALVHYYFRTKDNLFESIFESKARILLSGFHGIQGSATTFEQALTRLVGSHFDLLAANPRIPSLLATELLTNPQRISSLRSRLEPLPVGILRGLQAMLDTEIASGNIRPTSLVDLFITLVSLNASLFLAAPVLKTITGMSDEAFQALLRHRREENIRIVLASLRPDPDRKPTKKKPDGPPRTTRSGKGRKA